MSRQRHNKEEELEVQLQSYDLWDHRDIVGWFTQAECCKGETQALQMDRPGRQGGGVALMWKSSWSVQSSTLGQVRASWDQIESSLAGKPTWVLLVSATGHMVIEDMKKAKVLNAVFGSVFTSKTSLQESQASATRVKSWTKEDLLFMEEDQVRERLNKLNIHNES